MAEGRKKILFLITKGNMGGAQRYVFDLATRLPMEAFNPVVAYGEGGALGEALGKLGLRTVHIPELQRDVSVLKEAKVLASLVRLLKEERPDVLHLNSSKIGVLGALAGRIARVPRIVFTAHNWASNDPRYGAFRHAFKLLHWLGIMLCDVTIAVSEKTRSDMASLPFAAKRLRVIHNGIAPVEFGAKQTVRTLVAPHIHEAVWIGTASELNRNKGVDFALRAFAPIPERYKHAAFVVMGDGEDRAKLEALAERLGIAGKVHFLGNVPNAGTLMKAFDVFTLTSRNEALPYALMEAGLAETAVVASRVGGIPEIVTDGKEGALVAAGDVDAITAALVDLVEHPKKREQLGKRLAARIAKRFSVDKMVAETAKAYAG